LVVTVTEEDLVPEPEQPPRRRIHPHPAPINQNRRSHPLTPFSLGAGSAKDPERVHIKPTAIEVVKRLTDHRGGDEQDIVGIR
jgi:energy-converting hydrogenase Eha subunit F